MEWRGFELHPETPVGGMRLDRLFPADQIPLMAAHIQRLSNQHGAGEIKVGDRLPNTRRALAVAEYARDEGRLEEFKTAAMSGYWREGLDLENQDHLKTIIERADIDTVAGLAAQDDPKYLARVDEMRAEASKAGVTGIPTSFFSDGPVIVGAQSYEKLMEAAQAAGASRRE